MASPGYERNKKWRLNHPDKRRDQVRRRHSKTTFAPNGGKEWTEAEEKMVLEHAIPDFQLAKKLGRSEHSIQIKRHRLNKAAEQLAATPVDFNAHDLVETKIISDVKASYLCKCGAKGGTHMASHLASPTELIQRATKNHELHQVRALTKMLKDD